MKFKNNIVKYTEPLLLAGLWLAVFAAPLIMFHNEGEFAWGRLISAWNSVIPFFIIFLFNHFILVPYVLFKNKRLLYIILAVIAVIVFSVSINYFENNRPINQPKIGSSMELPPPHLQPDFDRPPPDIGPPGKRPDPFPLPRFVNSIILAILIIGFDTGIKMIVRWSKLERERTILEKENVQNQLAFFNYFPGQVHPVMIRQLAIIGHVPEHQVGLATGNKLAYFTGSVDSTGGVDGHGRERLGGGHFHLQDRQADDN